MLVPLLFPKPLPQSSAADRVVGCLQEDKGHRMTLCKCAEPTLTSVSMPAFPSFFPYRNSVTQLDSVR